MTFPRLSGLVLAIGGSIWALLPFWSVFSCLHSTGDMNLTVHLALFWGAVMVPGYVAWYGYIRRSLGHFLFGRAFVTWLVSIVANLWSLSWVLHGAGGMTWLLSVSWSILAIILSVTALFQEIGVRETQ